jgi:hypothetical protein
MSTFTEMPLRQIVPLTAEEEGGINLVLERQLDSPLCREPGQHTTSHGGPFAS